MAAGDGDSGSVLEGKVGAGWSFIQDRSRVGAGVVVDENGYG